MTFTFRYKITWVSLSIFRYAASTIFKKGYRKVRIANSDNSGTISTTKQRNSTFCVSLEQVGPHLLSRDQMVVYINTRSHSDHLKYRLSQQYGYIC